ncbi:uracil phosphoribosyltransferase [Ureaplasma urealyticum]|uniref:Uracil phosphoribosyltransferase n=4 Tax=Ureaplasma urealyticum TaxID=2130 RepID=UPP_UREU1|nr:uracil phosphoribosyltransferase [Ureaplasma urealyticum]B5ZAU8.1 RecName: Full=Uracil phosphoribosyltransferase; AltName: Full=UMP pyrophosphorylase; AltName: Full=UPRTase [Ureaplasma urealyticum serovar 10 str. ATCC 33699]EDX53824.1 uracil phosphoribosyltransferase [Ureaplasma urealyticum serovar 9 str. ATCC 33175]RCT49642.1 uracil phosphoribosyltransferase [Ureaplasma parvum]ACI60045.1 uracil phosphoribosyltransferase [Ureaplasma urealyticum serovar 10 str. ATCC 33699]EDT49894.1 uracil p
MHKIINHPLIKDKLTRMRKVSTVSTVFRTNLEELTQLMVYEATKDLELNEIEIETPVVKNAKGYKLKNKICLIPILRAGIGMVDGVKSLIPTATIGHIGLYRNEETLKPVEYFKKFPKNISESDVIILDPMLATGGSVVEAVNIIKKYNPKSIKFVCIVAAPEGLEYVQKIHPDVDVYIAALDDKLNENGYITPGLGDAGDRIFGTK